MWRQKSSVQWLAEGDKNTRFFHERACRRRKKNIISRLKRLDGTISENEKELGTMATSFYQHLYSSEGVDDMDRVMDVIPAKVIAQMNESLKAAFREEEVRDALFHTSMFPTKAPGPDWYPAHFF